MTESKGERYHQLSPGKQLKKQMNKTSTTTVGGGDEENQNLKLLNI